MPAEVRARLPDRLAPVCEDVAEVLLRFRSLGGGFWDA